jgi:tetratricopeptide (TPR) repeat protein
MHQGKDITPRELTQLPPDGPFFDAKSPSDVPMATVFFGRDLDGLLRPYSYPGLNPLTGAALEPATLELVREWRTGRLVAIAREESTAVAGRRAAEELERQEQARKKAEERRQAVRQARAEELRVRTGYAGASFNELREMAPLEPDNAMLHYELGTRLAGEGDREGALRSFRQALRANPGFTAARTRIEELGGQP